MLQQLDLGSILFLDIETVRGKNKFEELDEDFRKLWEEKTRRQRGEDTTPEEHYMDRAGILAEFGKVVCISVGFFARSGGLRNFRLKSFYGHDEKILLAEFAELLDRHYSHSQQLLCAHNGKEFDFPYLCRRMLIQGIRIPDILNIQGKKPWEVAHLDTMELWKFGDYKNYTSLKLLAAVFGIPTPKDDIDGSMVSGVYWEEEDIERIARYCEKDTLTVAQLLLRMRGEDILREEEIEIAS